ncbi:MAG: urease accessory protein UreF [Aquamicrobium sp.]|nr:urease accessory protein UreF [Aquamicrobium sp.]
MAKPTNSGAFPATRITGTTMPERGTASLLRLMAWLSPAFPVGSFSYSHGLERTVHDGLVESGSDLAEWIATLLAEGSGWNDAVLLAESFRLSAAGTSLADMAELAEAMAGSAERHLESTLQGAAFLTSAAAWQPDIADRLPANCPYSVAVGAVAGMQGVGLESALAAYIQAFASNMIQAAIRLSVIGQSDAVAILAGLETTVAQTAARASLSSLDDLGSATLVVEIAAMNHETQYSRLFRS